MKLRENYEFTGKQTALIGVLLVSILAAVLWRIRSLDGIYIIGDEFGYWADAAFFAGKNWSEVGSMNPYYSFGYSLILAPLFLLGKPALMYKAAVLLNGVFLCGSFLLTIFCGKKLFRDLNRWNLILLSWCVNVFSSMILYAQTTLAENLIVFVFLLGTALYFRFLEKPGYLRACLTGLAFGYLYSIHMRTLTVLVALAFCMILVFRQKKASWRYILTLALTVAVCVFAANQIKEILVENVYLSNASVSTNDYSGQVQKLSSLMSVDGVLALFFSFLGKVWYVGCSTFFLAWWGVVFLVHRVHSSIRKKEMGVDEHRILFLLLAFLGALAINCIYMSYFGRVDTLIYGRYSEYVYILILFVGLYAMMQSRHRGKLCAIFSVAAILLTFCVRGILDWAETTTFIYSNNVVGISKLAEYFGLQVGNRYFELAVCVETILAALVLTLFFEISEKKKWRAAAGIIALFLGACWIYLGDSWADRQVYGFQSRHAHENMVSLMNEISPDSEVYYIVGEEADSIIYKRSDFIQFQILDRTVHVINVEDMDQYPEGFFIVDKFSAALSEAEEQLENLFSENFLVLGVKPGSPEREQGEATLLGREFTAPESCQSTSTRVSGDMLQTFGTKSGRLTRSDSLYLGKGAYEITWNLKTEDPAAAGSIECEVQVNEEKRQASSADGTDFADGTLAVTQIFYNTENLPVHLCVCLDETSSAELESITYRKLESSYRFAEGAEAELTDVIRETGLEQESEVFVYLREGEETYCTTELLDVCLPKSRITFLSSWDEMPEGGRMIYTKTELQPTQCADGEVLYANGIFGVMEKAKNGTSHGTSDTAEAIDGEVLMEGVVSSGGEASYRPGRGDYILRLTLSPEAGAYGDISVNLKLNGAVKRYIVKDEEPLVLESFLHQTTENPITLEYLIQASGFVTVENIEFIPVQLEEDKDSLLSALESYGHRVYIEILYQTLLQRDADEEGLNYWQNALAGDLERSDLYDAIVTSEEYRIRIQGENP